MKRRGFFRALAGASVASTLPVGVKREAETVSIAYGTVIVPTPFPPAGSVLVRRADGETEWALPEQIEWLA